MAFHVKIVNIEIIFKRVPKNLFSLKSHARFSRNINFWIVWGSFIYYVTMNFVIERHGLSYNLCDIHTLC